MPDPLPDLKAKERVIETLLPSIGAPSMAPAYDEPISVERNRQRFIEIDYRSFAFDTPPSHPEFLEAFTLFVELQLGESHSALDTNPQVGRFVIVIESGETKIQATLDANKELIEFRYSLEDEQATLAVDGFISMLLDSQKEKLS